MAENNETISIDSVKEITDNRLVAKFYSFDSDVSIPFNVVYAPTTRAVYGYYLMDYVQTNWFRIQDTENLNNFSISHAVDVIGDSENRVFYSAISGNNLLSEEFRTTLSDVAEGLNENQFIGIRQTVSADANVADVDFIVTKDGVDASNRAKPLSVYNHLYINYVGSTGSEISVSDNIMEVDFSYGSQIDGRIREDGIESISGLDETEEWTYGMPTIVDVPTILPVSSFHAYSMEETSAKFIPNAIMQSDSTYYYSVYVETATASYVISIGTDYQNHRSEGAESAINAYANIAKYIGENKDIVDAAILSGDYSTVEYIESDFNDRIDGVVADSIVDIMDHPSNAKIDFSGVGDEFSELKDQSLYLSTARYIKIRGPFVPNYDAGIKGYATNGFVLPLRENEKFSKISADACIPFDVECNFCILTRTTSEEGDVYEITEHPSLSGTKIQFKTGNASTLCTPFYDEALNASAEEYGCAKYQRLLMPKSHIFGFTDCGILSVNGDVGYKQPFQYEVELKSVVIQDDGATKSTFIPYEITDLVHSDIISSQGELRNADEMAMNTAKTVESSGTPPSAYDLPHESVIKSVYELSYEYAKNYKKYVTTDNIEITPFNGAIPLNKMAGDCSSVYVDGSVGQIESETVFYSRYYASVYLETESMDEYSDDTIQYGLKWKYGNSFDYDGESVPYTIGEDGFAVTEFGKFSISATSDKGVEIWYPSSSEEGGEITWVCAALMAADVLTEFPTPYIDSDVTEFRLRLLDNNGKTHIVFSKNKSDVYGDSAIGETWSTEVSQMNYYVPTGVHLVVGEHDESDAEHVRIGVSARNLVSDNPLEPHQYHGYRWEITEVQGIDGSISVYDKDGIAVPDYDANVHGSPELTLSFTPYSTLDAREDGQKWSFKISVSAYDRDGAPITYAGEIISDSQNPRGSYWYDGCSISARYNFYEMVPPNSLGLTSGDLFATVLASDANFSSNDIVYNIIDTDIGVLRNDGIQISGVEAGEYGAFRPIVKIGPTGEHASEIMETWGRPSVYVKSPFSYKCIPFIHDFDTAEGYVIPTYSYNCDENKWVKNGSTVIGGVHRRYYEPTTAWGNYGLYDGKHKEEFHTRVVLDTASGIKDSGSTAFSVNVSAYRLEENGSETFVDGAVADTFIIDDACTAINTDSTFIPPLDILNAHYRMVAECDVLDANGNSWFDGIPNKYYDSYGIERFRKYHFEGEYSTACEVQELSAEEIGMIGPTVIDIKSFSDQKHEISGGTIEFPVCNAIVDNTLSSNCPDIDNTIYGEKPTVSVLSPFNKEGEFPPEFIAQYNFDGWETSGHSRIGINNVNSYFSLIPNTDDSLAFCIKRGEEKNLSVDIGIPVKSRCIASGTYTDIVETEFICDDWKMEDRTISMHKDGSLSGMPYVQFYTITPIIPLSGAAVWYSNVPTDMFDRYVVENLSNGQTEEITEFPYVTSGYESCGYYGIRVSAFKTYREEDIGREKTAYIINDTDGDLFACDFTDYTDEVKRTQLSENITFDYDFNDVKVGPNEFITSDLLNSRFDMLYHNFNQLLMYSKYFNASPYKYNGYFGFYEEMYSFWNCGKYGDRYPLSANDCTADSGTSRFKNATSMDMDEKANLYITSPMDDSKSNVCSCIVALRSHLNQQIAALDYYSVNSTSPEISSVLVLKNGKVFAVANGMDRVFCCSDVYDESDANKLRFLYDWGDFGGPLANLKFNSPIAIATDDFEAEEEQHVYVLDGGNKCVKKFTQVGGWRATVTYDLLENEVAIDLAVGMDGSIHVLTNKRVIMLDEKEGKIGEYTFDVDDVTRSNPICIKANKCGKFVYILFDDDILKYTTDGRYMCRLVASDKFLRVGKEINRKFGKFKYMCCDSNNYIYIMLENIILSYSDAVTINGILADTINDKLWTPAEIHIGKQEYMQDWVINTSLHRLYDNINLFRSALFGRVRVVDKNGRKMITFEDLSQVEHSKLKILSKDDVFVASNNAVSSKIINDQLEKLYNMLVLLRKYVQDEMD